MSSSLHVGGGRKRGDSASSLSSASSSSSSNKKGRGERLLRRDRRSDTVRSSFVNGTDLISDQLVSIVSDKACQFVMHFMTADGGDTVIYYGQGGLIQGNRLTESPPTDVARPKKRSRTTVTFGEFASFQATPVTAKHNLESENGEIYGRVSIQTTHGAKRDVVFADGGSRPEQNIEVRAPTADTDRLSWPDNDWSKGEVLGQPGSAFTKKPRLFEAAPDGFVLRVGHRVGIVVYRTFDITHEDAGIMGSTSVHLEMVYGPKEQPCIYTGNVTEISGNGKTFCHDINTFAGCSGAVVFLLDVQLDHISDVSSDLYGKAVGVHVGGLDVNNNIGFLLT